MTAAVEMPPYFNPKVEQNTFGTILRVPREPITERKTYITVRRVTGERIFIAVGCDHHGAGEIKLSLEEARRIAGMIVREIENPQVE
jgi:hypothetical protein